MAVTLPGITQNILSLGDWPEAPDAQQRYLREMGNLIAQLQVWANDHTSFPVYVESATEPSQSEWEAEWLSQAQTGELPIPHTATLLWWDTQTSAFGGLYGTLPGDGTVRGRHSKNTPGATTLLVQDSKAVYDNAVVHAYGSEPAGKYPEVSFTLPVECTLILYANMCVWNITGSGTWAMTFKINGTDLATQAPFSQPANTGFVQSSETGVLSARAAVYEIAAGAHTISVGFGVTSGSPTLGVGGGGANTMGIMNLIVRAIAS